MLGLNSTDIIPGHFGYPIAAQLPDDFTTSADPDNTDESGRQIERGDIDGHD